MKRKNAINIVFICLAILGIFLADNYFNFGFSATLTNFLKPVGIVFETVGKNTLGSFDSVRKIGGLQKDNKELTDKLNQALSQIAVLTEYQKENESLKRDLNFKKLGNFDLLAANVVAFDPSNIRDSITIDVGKNDGINEGNVVVSEGFLVGKISSVSNGTAKIKLISDPLSAVPGTILDTSITGIVKGTIGSSLTLEQVPQSEKVDSGNYVLTSGLGGDYPKGIIIGKVEDIQKVSGSIFQMITVKPMVDFGRLERVMVIKK